MMIRDNYIDPGIFELLYPGFIRAPAVPGND